MLKEFQTSRFVGAISHRVFSQSITHFTALVLNRQMSTAQTPACQRPRRGTLRSGEEPDG